MDHHPGLVRTELSLCLVMSTPRRSNAWRAGRCPPATLPYISSCVYAARWALNVAAVPCRSAVIVEHGAVLGETVTFVFVCVVALV